MKPFRHLSRILALQLAAIVACPWALQPCLLQEDAVAPAMAALEHGDYSSAEQILKARLRLQPKDTEALSVLAVVLDQEKKYAEAGETYRRALAAAPPDPALLNNFGNHLLATGKPADARKAFLQVISLQAGNPNALVQLAKLSLERKAPAEALGYLDRIPPAAADRPDAALLRMQADYQLGHRQEADAILARVSSNVTSDPRQNLALAVALASVAQYAQAETFFSKTLEADPSNFEALYDLGLAASHAGHKERARGVLEHAVTLQPENVDVVYDLAAVDVSLDQKEAALALLAKASRLAPQRADVLELEARTAASLGYFADATAAWDAYLKLMPFDEAAHRERAFAQTATGENMAVGLAELNAFVRKHPGDPIGHYELGTAETRQPEEALKELNRALDLKPDLTAAHVARGLLLYRQGRSDRALTDFQFAAQKDPGSGSLLDRLGETYMALNRPADALPALRKAAERLPSNSAVLLHLARALTKTGQTDQAAAVFARCRELGPNKSSSPHPAGLVEFLGLSPDEQRTRYQAGVEHTVQNYPDNVAAQVRYLAILLDNDETEKAAAVVGTISTLKPSAALLTDAANSLLNAGQYSLARQLLGQNGSANSPELRLDLAIANFHMAGAQAGLDTLNTISQSQRTGDYYLARAQMLDAQGSTRDAELAIEQAIKANPASPALYHQAALLLIKNHHLDEALQLLAAAARSLPDNPDLLLLQALTLELAGSPVLSDTEFSKLENGWPEWYKIWLGNALVLEARRQHEKAQPLRQAAVALGAPPELANLGRQDSFSQTELLRVLPLLLP